MRFSWKISKYLIGAVLPYFIFSWLLLSVILFVQQASRFSDIFFSVNIPTNLVWQLTFALVPSVIESHGAAIVIRPIAPLAYSGTYRVVMTDVADVAGNALAAPAPLSFGTPRLVGTNAPPTVLGIHPGVPCSLTGGTVTTAGRCS